MKESAVLSRVKDGRCAVLGYGVSNRPLVEWLMAHGAAAVEVRDGRELAALTESGDADRIARAGATLVCGKDYLVGLSADVIFRTPGMRPDLPEIRAAVEAGAILSSEMELFLSLTEATVVGISGSDGKTTTTTLISRLLTESCKRQGRGRVFLGGNIGNPLLPEVEHMTADDFAVVELSSFQLMTVTGSPDRAVLTNLSENHLNWHHGMEEYVRAKANICGGEGSHEPPRTTVLNAENAYTRSIGERLDAPVIWFSGSDADLPSHPPRDVDGDGYVWERDGVICLSRGRSAEPTPMLAVSEIRLLGRHNVENYMAAIAAVADWITAEDVLAVARSFTGVPHRFELVAQRGGVRYINGSIDSTPTRTLAALAAMRELRRQEGGGRLPIVILGGRDKNTSFEELGAALCREAKAVVLTGEARDIIRRAIMQSPEYDPDDLSILVIPDWQDAMRSACMMATEGDTVLLSPACTSFDAFKNFEERGEAFRAVVREVTQK